jgi:hypothetical protein
MSSASIRWRILGDVGVAAVFTAITCMHLVFGADRGGAGRDNRALAAKPQLPIDLDGVAGYIRGLEKWFDDHFAFRAQLQSLHARICLDVFGVSPTSQVVIGEQGWLYYTKQGVFPDRRGENSLGDDACAAWRAELEQRQAFLRERGVPYVFAVVPNKETIHPEHLPARHLPVSGRPTRLDQLVRCFAEGSSFRLLDGRPLLAGVARERQAYHATDSHWNEIGAFVFYRALVDELRSQGLAIEAVAADRFTPVKRPFHGDLGLLVPWLNTPAEAGWLMTPLAPHPSQRVDLGFDHRALPPAWNVWDPPVAHVCPGQPGVLLFVGDSFQWPMIPWLARHFGASVFLSVAVTDFAVFRQLVEIVKPTAVIEERAERNMAFPPTRRR